MKRRDFIAWLSAGPAGLSTWPLASWAQNTPYPDRPIKLVVPYPPGASSDAMGRLVAQKISGPLGQPVVVDNRSGASGNIGTEAVAKSAADGYTLLLGTDATHSANVHLMAQPSFHPVRDFTPLSLAALNPIVLVVHPSMPVKTLAELVAYVKAHPQQGGFGSSGSGSPHHLAGELLKQRTGAPLVHIPYRGGGPALNDVMGGQLPMLFASLITVLQHIQSGRLRAVAVTSAQRIEALPQVPTVAETLEGFELNSWLAFFGPARMPEPIARRLSDEIAAAVRDPDSRSKLRDGGLLPVGSTGAELAELVRRDLELRGRLIRAANIKPE
jgi:tripartite-type tricarboxylate transporter receptor subunit TctC